MHGLVDGAAEHLFVGAKGRKPRRRHGGNDQVTVYDIEVDPGSRGIYLPAQGYENETEGIHDGLPFASRVMGPAAAENGRFFQTGFLPIKSLNLTAIVMQEIPSRMMTTVLNRGKCE